METPKFDSANQAVRKEGTGEGKRNRLGVLEDLGQYTRSGRTFRLFQ